MHKNIIIINRLNDFSLKIKYTTLKATKFIQTKKIFCLKSKICTLEIELLKLIKIMFDFWLMYISNLSL